MVVILKYIGNATDSQIEFMLNAGFILRSTINVENDP